MNPHSLASKIWVIVLMLLPGVVIAGMIGKAIGWIQ
jgi:type III secretory pathway component EscS